MNTVDYSTEVLGKRWEVYDTPGGYTGIRTVDKKCVLYLGQKLSLIVGRPVAEHIVRLHNENV
jgi:hypothetical protein